MKRLVQLADAVLRNPAGLVTEVCGGSAERQGAYKFLENAAASVTEISAAACRAAAKRAEGMPYVFAPVDGTTLALREYHGEAERGVGAVGARSKGGTGLHVMSAIAIDPTGVPLGVLAQAWWVRSKQPQKTPHKKRTLAQKETRYWLAAQTSALEEWEAANASTKLWFQDDRGADFREMLAWAEQSSHRVTVRAAWDRRTLDSEQKYLWETLEAQPVRARTFLELPETKKRKARTAELELRWSQVNIRLIDPKTSRTSAVSLWALLAREVGTPADSSDTVEWLLLTNYPIASKADAELVLLGYTQRWRVEQFHKIWKSVCRVEDTELREVANIERWAAIEASVSMRLLRLTYLARVNPGAPASVELSSLEIAALVVTKGRDRYKLGDTPTIAEATRWVAELGGYTGPKVSGGPPGSIVLARGLRKLTAKAEAFAEILEFSK